MDPVIWAAIVGVGGSVIVALVGFFTTRAISGQTMRASMAEAHDNRIWDKKATAYETALTELANRKLERESALRLPPDPMTAGEQLANYFATRDTPEWLAAEGRLMAYSSKKVWDALQAARSYDCETAGLNSELKERMEEAHQFQRDGNHPGMQQVIDQQVSPAVKKTSEALRTSVERDRALFELIRGELQMQPRYGRPRRSKFAWRSRR